MSASWEEVVAEKRKSVNDSIPKEWVIPNLKNEMVSKGFVNTSEYLDTILPPDEIEITRSTTAKLTELIQTGKLTAVSVTKAFAHRAMLAHQILNCCSEIFIDKALERAQELDDIFHQTGKTVGCLHGIPISLKDQVDLVGIPSAIGYVSLANTKKTKNALLASKLLDLGAIFFVKTAVPMAMMAPETASNLFPYTFSGANVNLSSGGSSGGEGSLIAAGGARLGFGTDIGGSIRIPAAYNGLFALKPSVGRISYLRVSNSYADQEAIPSVIGPLAQSLEELECIFKIIVDTKCWLDDPKVLPLEWKAFVPPPKIKIGVWFDSGHVEPLPPISRVLGESFQDLSTNVQFEVVKIQWPDHSRLIKALFDVFAADGGREILEECQQSGEPVHGLLDYLVGVKNPKPGLDINAWWSLCHEVYSIKEKYLQFWKENSLDAILAPIMASTSLKPYDSACLDYTGVCNLCDCSSVVLPLGAVDAQLDVVKEKNPRSELEGKIWNQYDPETFDKMPVCLQLITRKSEEEKGLTIAKAILSASRYYK